MPRVLVVYFSRDGHTGAIASEIALACGGAVEAITEASDRSGLLGWLRSALESLLRIAPPLHSLQTSVRPDDLVVIGTPVWSRNLASPVRSYLLAHRERFSRVALFCTCAHPGRQKTLREMRVLCRRVPVAALTLTEAQCAAGAHERELAGFLRALGHPPAADASFAVAGESVS